jgi:hypothetical protein
MDLVVRQSLEKWGDRQNLNACMKRCAQSPLQNCTEARLGGCRRVGSGALWSSRRQVATKAVAVSDL